MIQLGFGVYAGAEAHIIGRFSQRTYLAALGQFIVLI